MIKKFETFNDSTDSNRWIIRTDAPYFELSMIEIGMPRHIIEQWLLNKNIQYYKRLYVTKRVATSPRVDPYIYEHVPLELIKNVDFLLYDKNFKKEIEDFKKEISDEKRKKEERLIKMLDVDPYGEEDW